MLPTLRAGDLLLVRYAGSVRPGALVLARFADGTLAVKRAVERRTSRSGAPAWWLLSDNPDQGVDSRHRGAVADDHVPAVVVARAPSPPRGGAVFVDAARGPPVLCHTGTRATPWSDEFREPPFPRRAGPSPNPCWPWAWRVRFGHGS
jgi:hypothetical protein